MSLPSSLRRVAVASAVLLAAVFTGTSAAQAASTSAGTTSGPVCDPLPGPAATVRLTVADDGRTVCVVRGRLVFVTLSVDPAIYPDPANWWTPIASTGKALTRLPDTMLPVRGTTVALYRADGDGTPELTSTWSPCPPPSPGAPICAAPIRLWHVTVIVVG